MDELTLVRKRLEDAETQLEELHELLYIVDLSEAAQIVGGILRTLRDVDIDLNRAEYGPDMEE